MTTPNTNEQDKYPQLTTSIASRMLMTDPKLALEPVTVFEQARKASAVLGPQGFTGVDRITNLPGGVTLYEQGDRTSRLTFDDAKKIVAISLQQIDANAPEGLGIDLNITPGANTPDTLSATYASNDGQPASADGKTPAVPPSTQIGATLTDAPEGFGLDANVATTINDREGTLTSRLNITPGPKTPDTFSVNYTSNDGQPAVGKTPAVPPSTQIGATLTNAPEGFGLDANVATTINDREGTLTSRLNITPGPKTPDTFSVNYFSNDGQPAVGKTPAVPPSTQIGATLTNAPEGLGIDASVATAVNDREGTLSSRLNITPGPKTPDTFSVNYVSSDGQPAVDKTPAVPPSTQIGATLTDAPEGLGLAANLAAAVNGREGMLTSSLNITPGANTADTASVSYAKTTDEYNRWRVDADYSTGAQSLNGQNGSPAGLNLSGTYNAGTQALNYGVNATVGRDNIVGGFLNAETPTVQASTRAQYNFDTDVGQATGRVTYTHDRGVSAYAAFSANTNGETAATFGVVVGLGGEARSVNQDTDAQRLVALQNSVEENRRLDSALVDIQISRLTGNDRKLYDQALAGVNTLNDGGANLPPRETALSLAALANSQNPPLAQIGDVGLWPPGAGGAQRLYVGNGALDDPATRSASIERNEAANAPAEQSIAKLSENNATQSLQNRGDQQQSVDNQEQSQPSRAIAGR